jgi:hypothetical protein
MNNENNESNEKKHKKKKQKGKHQQQQEHKYNCGHNQNMSGTNCKWKGVLSNT